MGKSATRMLRVIRLYNSAEKMEYEKRQLLAEKNRRLKVGLGVWVE